MVGGVSPRLPEIWLAFHNCPCKWASICQKRCICAAGIRMPNCGKSCSRNVRKKAWRQRKLALSLVARKLSG